VSTQPPDLLGAWSLTRVVDDRLSGTRRDVRGVTTLSLEAPDRVRWHEEGTMTWSGHVVAVTRTLYVEGEDTGWFVHFEDGRPFHPWTIDAPVDHPCGRDHYRGLITIHGDPVTRWTVEWEVLGPAKDYRMTSDHVSSSQARSMIGE
jgi:hypothetical protein